MPYSPYGLQQLAIDPCTSTNPGSLFLSVDQSFMAVNGAYVYFSTPIVNDGRYAYRISKATQAVTMTYPPQTSR
jgi:hypothetical protein